MTTLGVWRLFSAPIHRISVRGTGSIASEPKTEQNHIYKKTYTRDELVNYITSNVVCNYDDFIVTSIPQGVRFFKYDRYNDTEREVVCDTSLQDLVPQLAKIFDCRYLFVSKQPRRNASGLVILAKNFKAFRSLRNQFNAAQCDFNRIFTYLAVVRGRPFEGDTKLFRVEQVLDGTKFATNILEGVASDTRKTQCTKYRHSVIDSSEHVSLLKISVSYDLRDCVRHILAQRYFTPVFGDFWSAKRTVSFLFGAPLAGGSAVECMGPYELEPDILKRLHLSKEEQEYIPIHAHLFGLRMTLKSKKELFISVPPPESFVWTCRQLGLNGINQFVHSIQHPEEVVSSPWWVL